MDLLREFAAEQHGLVTREQCLACGLYPGALVRAIEREEIERVLPDVYRLTGAPPSRHQDLMAACLWSGSGAASHRSAAALHGLKGYDLNARDAQGVLEPLQIIAPKRGLSVPQVQVYRRVPNPQFVMQAEGIPVMNPAMTLINLAEVEPDPVVFENTVDEVMRRNFASEMQLRWAMAKIAGPGRRGVGRLARLLDDRGPKDGPSASAFQKSVRALLAPEGDFVEEYEIRDVRGRLIAVVDFAYPPLRLGVEGDGFEFHGGRQGWWHDLRRRNAITARHWTLLHITPDDLADPRPFLSSLRAAMAA
ncbi:MAG TPA: type IV toxin-antitoxin system AbiEi family antitoxin domain-containing protein [Actinomycetota bacterium]|nr:type IV toxin-antitoxin system AbiEi family antitoxin domain-containing protein [Actinomycetota bacterium]